MRYRDRVAAGPVPQALLFQVVPQMHLGGRLYPAQGPPRNPLVAKNHVVVQVLAGAHAGGPLVADKAGELTAAAAIVGLLGRILYIPPGVAGGGKAGSVVLPAKAPAFFPGHAVGPEGGEGILRQPAVGDTDRVPVTAGPGGGAQAHLTHELGVIGDRREIQGPIDLDLALGAVLVVVGLDAHGRAAGEGIGIRGLVARILAAGVERPGGVHMGVAEPGAAQRLVIGAGFALLGDGVGPRRRGAVQLIHRRWLGQQDARTAAQ